MEYKRPTIEIIEADLVLLQSSETGPGATDIGAPNVSNNSKSIWDEDSETHYNNIKEEQDYGEDWI